jgi:hypothetical protein
MFKYTVDRELGINNSYQSFSPIPLTDPSRMYVVYFYEARDFPEVHTKQTLDEMGLWEPDDYTWESEDGKAVPYNDLEDHLWRLKLGEKLLCFGLGDVSVEIIAIGCKNYNTYSE